MDAKKKQYSLLHTLMEGAVEGVVAEGRNSGNTYIKNHQGKWVCQKTGRCLTVDQFFDIEGGVLP